MNYVEQCPKCGGSVVAKKVSEVLRGGCNSAFLTVNAGVCTHCGERLFTPDVIRRFEEIEGKLEREDTDGLQPVGRSFEVALS